MQAVSIRASRLCALQLALAGSVLLLAPAAAEAYTTRAPQRAGFWDGARTPRAKPARIVKRVPAKSQARNQKPAQVAKPAEAAAPAKPAEHAGTWTAGEGGRACLRSRRKLWQAEEGWVVKKVNVCP